jgi:hypothetical protein
MEIILARHRWLSPITLATQEAEIKRIKVQSNQANSLRDPILKKAHHKTRAGRVAQGVDPEFKPQYQKKNHSAQPVVSITESELVSSTPVS